MAGAQPKIIRDPRHEALRQRHQVFVISDGRARVFPVAPDEHSSGGKRVELTVNLREMPTNYGERTARTTEPSEEGTESKHYDKLGLQVGPLTSDVAQQLGISGTSGVVITAVEDGSPADKAGLAPSQVITQVGRKSVKSAAEFEAEVKNASPDKGVLLLVRSAEGSNLF